MWTHPEDARTDFILAAAAAMLGWWVRGLVVGLPGYPRGGALGDLLTLGWVFGLTGLVPWLLARYRDEGRAAFGLDQAGGAATGLVLAVPVAFVGVVRLWAEADVGLPRALLGRLGQLSQDPARLTLQVAGIGVVFLGTLMLYTFLTVRARDAFGRTTVSQVEALRTFGMGAAGAALLLGLLTTLADVCSPASVLATAGGLAAVVLLADMTADVSHDTTRATVLGPAIVALLLNVLLRGGGLFGGNLLLSLYAGTVAGGLALVAAVVLETRNDALAVGPVFLAAAVYPSLLTPIPAIAGPC